MDEKRYICNICDIPLENKRVDFKYMNHHFFTDLPTCPKCGEVLILEELVKGRMAEVETELEDK